MGIVATNVCNFCQTEKDSVFHYMWQCVHAQTFWSEFERSLHNTCGNCSRLSLNPTLVLFGNDGRTVTDDGFDFILLHAKFFCVQM